MHDEPWERIFEMYSIDSHNFSKEPFILTAEQIKTATADYVTTANREVRILVKQDTRESRPRIFREKGLFILPIKNGKYAIIKGEGYVDIPEIKTKVKEYKSSLKFNLDTSLVGNSEMQHIDFAYASSLIRSFMKDDSLVLTIRGRKYTPKFSFCVGKQKITVQSVQTEVDAGYEGEKQVVLVEVKNSKADNVIIRQLYYPFRQWKNYTDKKVITLFFERIKDEYHIWQFEFTDINDYN
ncbi:hypothetical protein J7M00_01055, partial [bacterium]|nr:hypothetical protein [bacterium]